MEKFDQDLWKFLRNAKPRLRKLAMPMIEAKLIWCAETMAKDSRCMLDFKPSNVFCKPKSPEGRFANKGASH